MAERMFSRRFSWLLLVLAIASTSVRLVSAAAINPAPQDIPTFCTVDPRWAAPDVSRTDCLATVDKLYDIEVKPRTKLYEKDDFEFLSPKMPGTPGLESRSTPRKYTVGSCTLAIVLLRFFQDKQVPLPAKEEGFSAYRDVASFYELWEAGDRIRRNCLLGQNFPGMATEGGRDAIGVFMWATNSWQNHLVPSGDAMPPWSPRGMLMLNGTINGQAFSNRTTY